MAIMDKQESLIERACGSTQNDLMFLVVVLRVMLSYPTTKVVY